MRILNYRLLQKQILLFSSGAEKMKTASSFSVKKLQDKNYLTELSVQISSAEQKITDILIVIQVKIDSEPTYEKNINSSLFALLKPAFFVHINSLLADTGLPVFSWNVLNPQV